MQLYSDEFKYKLRSYNFFSIHLLRKTVEEFNIDVKPQEFKNMFFRFYLKNEKRFKKSIILNTSLNELLDNVNPNETIHDCLNAFDQLFYTPKGYLDGISLSILKESIIATYSLPYLKDLGLKYGVNIPKRINKSQLLDLVSTRFQLSEEEKQEIESKSITEIITFSKKKGFKVSSDLKKSDMVEYIIFTLNKYNEEVEKDLYNYDILVPSDNSDTDIEQDSLEQTDQAIPTSEVLIETEVEAEEETKEIVQDEPLVEETIEKSVIEEVKEENQAQEEITETLAENIDSEEVSEEEPVTEDTTDENIEETPIDASTEEETADEAEEVQDLSQPDIYYDQTVDEEIKDIIKKYYSKKLKKDTLLRIAMISIFALVVFFLVFFALKYYNIF